jgi:dTDP-4-amino-4,6-dideoxygalactose transaminase
MAAGEHYREAGLGSLVKLPKPLPGAAPAWHLYVIAHENIDRVQLALEASEIGCQPYYRLPVHRQAPMLAWGQGAELPGTEAAARSHLAIPMSPVLTREQAEQVTAAVRAGLAGS